MKKYLISLLLIMMLLTSCQREGIQFNAKELDKFLLSLESNNFTVTYNYDILSNNQPVYNVKCVFQITSTNIYRETKTYQNQTNKILAQAQIYSKQEKNNFVEYTYQTNNTGDGPSLIYVKDEIDFDKYQKSISYGKSVIFDLNYNYAYNHKEQYYYNELITIKLNNSQVIVTNKSKNIYAVYEYISTTKINEPSFVKKYKKDIIEY